MQCSNARSLVIRRVVSSKLALDILVCGRGRTSGNSLVRLTSALIRAILLLAAASRYIISLNNCGFFQIELSISHFHPQALSSWFRNFHRKSARFHEPQYHILTCL